MARKAAVTQAQVNQACEQLQENNKPVTVNAVINLVGGSFSTIGEKVKLWKEDQAANAAPVIEMPETVMLALHRSAADIWGAASTVANETIERIQTDAGEAIAKAKSELSEYAGEVSRLEKELEEAHNRASNAGKELSAIAVQLNDLNSIKAALEARLIDRDSELGRLRSDFEKLQSELIEIAKRKNKSDEK